MPRSGETSAVIAVILGGESTVQVASLPAAAAAAVADVDIAPTSPRPGGRTVNYSVARRMPVTFAGSAAADRQRLRA